MDLAKVNLALAQKGVLVKETDMGEKLLQSSVKACLRAFVKYPRDQMFDIAKDIKEYMDRKTTPSWHCIVGRSFGSFGSHEAGTFLYVYVHDLGIQIYKGAVST